MFNLKNNLKIAWKETWNLHSYIYMFKIVIVVFENTVFESWPFTWSCPNFMGSSEIRSVIFTWVMVAFLHSPLGIKETDVRPWCSGNWMLIFRAVWITIMMTKWLFLITVELSYFWESTICFSSFVLLPLFLAFFLCHFFGLFFFFLFFKKKSFSMSSLFSEIWLVLFCFDYVVSHHMAHH